MRVNTNRWNRLRYDCYAPYYDAIGRYVERGRRRSVELAALRPGERVLIVGAGTGLDFPLLPPGLDMTAIDLSPAMLERARRRAVALGLDVDCRVMDAHRLGFDDGAFDAVLLHLIVAVVPDAQVCVGEAARVLRPGGRAAIYDKFLPDAARLTLGRRLIGAVANVLATDLNRRLGPLLAGAGLVPEHDEPVMLRGLFRAVLARKPA